MGKFRKSKKSFSRRGKSKKSFRSKGALKKTGSSGKLYFRGGVVK